ncbi:Conjugative transposon protein TraA [Mucinivorans hirudinis]|uniref:Conjugative transposon protein TraA n=1 Tax=Mucinivorans hirudinis TaxID=1433126 RepID=A0A060R659_9BACT|nr:Conjugative transposon protein TraA [Mucinivorans hirudinis]
MKQETLFVAFSTQKGGAGKTTFTVLAASYLHYLKGYNVGVVDCDYPQHSIDKMRKRDASQIDTDESYKQLAFAQFKRLGKKAFPIINSTPEKAIETAQDFLESDARKFDILFFDLPGTVNSQGVLGSLANMDYIFTPISADRLVLESSLAFALTVNELLVTNPQIRLKGLHLFWNKVDGREKTDLYEVYEKSINEFGLPLLKTFIPDTTRYKKELSTDGRAVFRSTLFPADRRMLKGSRLEELLIEIAHIIKL